MSRSNRVVDPANSAEGYRFPSPWRRAVFAGDRAITRPGTTLLGVFVQ